MSYAWFFVGMVAFGLGWFLRPLADGRRFRWSYRIDEWRRRRVSAVARRHERRLRRR